MKQLQRSVPTTVQEHSLPHSLSLYQVAPAVPPPAQTMILLLAVLKYQPVQQLLFLPLE
jgi:hypothetical protein